MNQTDAKFWCEMLRDHAQFIHHLAANPAIIDEASAYLSKDDEYRSFSERERLRFVLPDAHELMDAVIAGEKGNSEYQLFTHMNEELVFLTDLLEGQMDQASEAAFWFMNAREHFRLLKVDVGKLDPMFMFWLSHGERDLSDQNMRDYSNSLEAMRVVIEEMRSYDTEVSLLAYKMTQHEYKEMKYGLNKMQSFYRK